MNEMMRASGVSINVLEFGPSVMEQLLTFMYTGIVDVSKMGHDAIGTLLSAAAHFQEIIAGRIIVWLWGHAIS
jgi:hypothetical protein